MWLYLGKKTLVTTYDRMKDIINVDYVLEIFLTEGRSDFERKKTLKNAPTKEVWIPSGHLVVRLFFNFEVLSSRLWHWERSLNPLKITKSQYFGVDPSMFVFLILLVSINKLS